MTKRHCALILFSLLPIAAACEEVCESGKGVQTPNGRLISTDCVDGSGYRTHQSIALDTKPLLVDEMLTRNDRNDARTIWIYSGPPTRDTGCAARLYLLDVALTPPKVLAFGIKGACNEFHWASWGNKRSVIALKKNVKFVYEDGRLTLPEKSTTLWKSIEPPHAGPGLGEQDAIPFVEVLLPK